MSDVLKIPEEGMRKFQLGEGRVFEVDVFRTYNLWTAEVERLRTESKCSELQAQIDVGCRLLKELSGADSVSGAQALRFIQMCNDQVDATLATLKKNTGETPSSAGSSDSTAGS